MLFVSSRLDNTNALLSGMSKTNLAKLQSVLNTAARIVSLSPKRCHITPILKDLHWLPIEKRIQYKLLVITFRCLHGFAPTYLEEMISVHKPTRILRSADKCLLSIPTAKLKTYGDRAFAVSAPTLWNNLPFNIRRIESINSFKTAIKTHLFKAAYNC